MFARINFVIYLLLSENVNTDLLKSSTGNWRLNDHNIATTLIDFNTSPMSCSPYTNEVLANDGNKINK